MVFPTKKCIGIGQWPKRKDIKNRWTRHLKELSSIIKPAVNSGFQSRITWTADVDEAIINEKNGVSHAKIASELGNGLTRNDINNRWTRHLKGVA